MGRRARRELILMEGIHGLHDALGPMMMRGHGVPQGAGHRFARAAWSLVDVAMSCPPASISGSVPWILEVPLMARRASLRRTAKAFFADASEADGWKGDLHLGRQ